MDTNRPKSRPITAINEAPIKFGMNAIIRSMVVVTAERPNVSTLDSTNVSMTSQKSNLATMRENARRISARASRSLIPSLAAAASSPTVRRARPATASIAHDSTKPSPRIRSAPTRLGTNPAMVAPSSENALTRISRQVSRSNS